MDKNFKKEVILTFPTSLLPFIFSHYSLAPAAFSLKPSKLKVSDDLATNTKDAFQSVSILTSLQHLALLTLFQNSPLPNPLPILRSPSHGIFLSLKPPQLSMLSFH